VTPVVLALGILEFHISCHHLKRQFATQVLCGKPSGLLLFADAGGVCAPQFDSFVAP
jgi:hypothetical protein